MHTRQLGRTDMHITPLGIGAWAIGGGNWEFGWGSQEDKESIAAIKRGVELGINWIDTAAVYGLGHSEEVVREAVREETVKGREKPLIFTKCSMVWDETGKITHSLKRDSIRREADASLKRLGVDTIDLYQIHWPDPDSEIEEGWSTLAELKQEGKVRHIGVSNFDVDQIKRAEKIAPVETVQPRYSLIHREVEKDVLPYCHEHNIGVIVYSPMASGLLSGYMTKERVQRLPDDDWRKHDPDFQEPRLSRNLELANLLAEIGYPYNVSAGVVAIAWTLRHPAVTGAIVGTRNPAQIEEMIMAAEFRLKENEIEQINEFFATHPE